jgi:uncharacterized membrane protein
MANVRGKWRIGNRIAPPRFLLFALVMIAASWIAIALAVPHGRALMLGFDIASGQFLVSLWPLLDEKSDDIRRRAKENDANRAGLLALTALVTLVVLIAVANELGGRQTTSDTVLVIITLALAWLFSNTVFALHYAHLFYSRSQGDDVRGLDFPNEAEPDYWDFTYFAFTLGMTFQTSDVSLESRQMRRVVTGHCLAAFVFNLGVIAFTINVLGN